jgi:hypothetical protein
MKGNFASGRIAAKLDMKEADRGNKDNEIKLMAARGYVFTEFSGGFEIACNTIAELIH